MIKVLIADDHPLVRRGIKQILDETPDIKVIDEAENGQEVLGKIGDGKYDVILLDIAMPGIGGLEALKNIKERETALPVIILSMYSEEQYAIRAIKAGASGYIRKSSDPLELIDAIRRVVSGRKYITPSLAEKLADVMGSESEMLPHEALSDREFQVMLLLAQGKSVKDIGEELNLSPNTVSTYKERVFKKTGFKCEVELAHYSLRNKLIES